MPDHYDQICGTVRHDRDRTAMSALPVLKPVSATLHRQV